MQSEETLTDNLPRYASPFLLSDFFSPNFRSYNEDLMVYECELRDDPMSQWQNYVTVDHFTCT